MAAALPSPLLGNACGNVRLGQSQRPHALTRPAPHSTRPRLVPQCSSASLVMPLMKPGRAHARLSTSSAFGRQLPSQASAPSRSGAPLRPPAAQWVHATARWRGRTLVVRAVLTDAPPASGPAPGTEEAVPQLSPEEERPASGSDSDELRALLERSIEEEPALLRGQLANGLRYVVLSNKLPPGRFEAHLEVHAGSVDEGPEEQGVAHLVEHVTFLGSTLREQLLGTGARANAYTDFHHTVFHVHAPLLNGMSQQPMLEQVLEALREIAFRPQFLSARIEKERLAVLAEAQMMNTIEYRVDCQLLQYLHEENNLGFRFPIGKTDQVKTWPHDSLRNFWKRWYFPANVTLYVVGDFDREIVDIQKLVETTFGSIVAARELLPAAPPAPPALEAANGTVPEAAAEAAPPPAAAPPAAVVSNGMGLSKPAWRPTQAFGEVKRRQPVRPPVEHRVGCGPLQAGDPTAGTPEIKMFRHPLLQHYMLSVFCKLPIQSMTKMEHLKHLLMMRIILSVFQSHINARYVDGLPKFIGIELDISDSGREGCAVSTLTVTAEPCNWAEATAIAVQEVRRLQRFGLANGEFERYRQAILRDSSQLAEQANKIPSVDTLNFLMESIACGHTVMSHRDAHAAMMQVADTVTLDEVNKLARSVLAFASHFGSEAALLEEAAAASHEYGYVGPTRATSVVVCIPAYVDESGQSVGGGGSASRGAALNAAGGHIDVDTVDLAALEKESQKLDEFEVPEGAIRFDLSPAEVSSALNGVGLEVTPTRDVELPPHLLPNDQLALLLAERQPTYVPLDGPGTSGSAMTPADPISGITQRRLSNGVRVNYVVTDHEPKAALLRLVSSGGRASEKLTTGPDGFGAVSVGTRTLSESGTVGTWMREQVEVFCVSNLINCALEADEENVVMDFHFAVGSGGMQAVFELLHLFLAQPVWEESAMDRAKQAFLLSGKSVAKSLERCTAERIMDEMLGATERRFRDPRPEELDALTLEGMRSAVNALVHTGNMEVNIVGDFDPAEIEKMVLNYLGTVPSRPDDVSAALLLDRPLAHITEFRSPPELQRHQTWHLTDSDERACAYIAGRAPCRWGPLGSTEAPPPPPSAAVLAQLAPPPPPLPRNASVAERSVAEMARRAHPLYASVTLMLLSEIMNSRLFTTVRDSLGLTYDVSFEVTMFDRLRTGWFSVHVTSHPDKIHEALAASVSVLRDVAVSPITGRELARARTTLLTRHESDLKDNVYWLGLMTHLQNPHVPLKSVQCLRDLTAMYESSTVEDMYDAYRYLKLEDDEIFTCVGTSGKVAPAIVDRAQARQAQANSPESRAVVDEMGLPLAGQPGGPAIAQAGMLNPMGMFTALLAAMNLTKGPPPPPAPPAGGPKA